MLQCIENKWLIWLSNIVDVNWKPAYKHCRPYSVHYFQNVLFPWLHRTFLCPCPSFLSFQILISDMLDKCCIYLRETSPVAVDSRAVTRFCHPHSLPYIHTYTYTYICLGSLSHSHVHNHVCAARSSVKGHQYIRKIIALQLGASGPWWALQSLEVEGEILVGWSILCLGGKKID